jgi:hypothetical protein
VASSSGLLAQAGGGSQHSHAGGDVDPVIDHLVRQIAAIHNAAQAGPRGEHFRSLAAQLRTLAVYDRQIGVDDQVRGGLRQLVNREGRNSVLYAEPDIEMRRRNLQSYGFRGDARQQRFPALPTHAEREAALNTLLERGVTPVFDRMAALADRIASRIDASPARPIAYAQDDDWWRGFCAELWNEYQQAQVLASPVCTLAKWFTAMFPSWRRAVEQIQAGAGAGKTVLHRG